MWNVFLFCAIVGGALFSLQFFLLLLGVGAEEMDSDGVDAGGVHLGDVDGADADATHLGVSDLHLDDAGAGHLDGTHLDGTHLDGVETHSGHVADGSHGSSELFRVLSVRTLVAAVTFFGLAGIASLQSGASSGVALVVALLAGGGALGAVYYMMRGLYRLRQDGTVRIQRTLSREGAVYIPIPAANSGTGKVQLRVQNRIMEYKAVTSTGERLATGRKVVVVEIVDGQTVRVEPVENCPL